MIKSLYKTLHQHLFHNKLKWVLKKEARVTCMNTRIYIFLGCWSTGTGRLTWPCPSCHLIGCIQHTSDPQEYGPLFPSYSMIPLMFWASLADQDIKTYIDSVSNYTVHNNRPIIHVYIYTCTIAHALTLDSSSFSSPCFPGFFFFFLFLVFMLYLVSYKMKYK